MPTVRRSKTMAGRIDSRFSRLHQRETGSGSSRPCDPTGSDGARGEAVTNREAEWSSSLSGMLDDLEALYKDVHRHPELSMHEERTAAVAAERLEAAGFEVATKVGKTGVVGLLRNGDAPTVMLRADMDALPVQEETGLDYA